jgi:hypothetical protein
LAFTPPATRAARHASYPSLAARSTARSSCSRRSASSSRAARDRGSESACCRAHQADGEPHASTRADPAYDQRSPSDRAQSRQSTVPRNRGHGDPRRRVRPAAAWPHATPPDAPRESATARTAHRHEHPYTARPSSRNVTRPDRTLLPDSHCELRASGIPRGSLLADCVRPRHVRGEVTDRIGPLCGARFRRSVNAILGARAKTDLRV